MDSLKMQKQYSIFSEGFTETMGTEIYFQLNSTQRVVTDAGVNTSLSVSLSH